ncbi:MAG: polyprenyl diphosphate synthase [Methylacidiphilales bacterium]|nr:polyprenyl diphosphate synthase [Candidatus Methylacidiphilales bacterium]
MHVAIIMDGNGRWAQHNSLLRSEGHVQGVLVVRSVISTAISVKIKHLTLFAFSIENNQRPHPEVLAICKLLVDTIAQEIPQLVAQGIKIKFIGDLSILSDLDQSELSKVVQITSNGTNLDLTIAFNYSGRWDISQAILRATNEKFINPSELEIRKLLPSSAIPDIDLLIRTGGSKRVSNFLLWQLAYSELYFTDILWPEFNEIEFTKAIQWYSKQTRTFGKIL